VSESCKDLARRLLTHQPDQRISWPEFFSHPWLQTSLPSEPPPIV
jgi:serine/threonine protein kinase